jgi:Tfp pilus assembly protein PilF
VNNQEETAKRLFEKALAYAPEPKAFLGLAMLLQKHRHLDRAIQTLDEGLAAFPENKDLNICMGVCLMNTGSFTQALAIFERFRQWPETGHYIKICHQHTSGT